MKVTRVKRLNLLIVALVILVLDKRAVQLPAQGIGDVKSFSADSNLGYFDPVPDKSGAGGREHDPKRQDGGGSMKRLALRAFALSTVASPASAVEPKKAAPLAELPSAPGPHVEQVKALKGNEWLTLDSPAADPKWGKGRGRSWTAHMPYAPDLKAAFLFGEGVHCWWNRDNNRYMDDLFVYDVQGHRWICVHPGTDVMNVDLQLDKNDFEVDKDGTQVPVAQLVHGYEMVSYDTARKRFMFMPGASQDWQAGAPFGKRRLAWGVKGQGVPTSCSPWQYDVGTGRWELLKVEGPAPRNTLANVSIYVPAAKKLFYWYPNEGNEVWFYDPATNAWSSVRAIAR